MKQKQLPRRYLKQPPTKVEVLRLLESCNGSGDKLAVGLAAFSGLKPGVLRWLTLRNLVEFSASGKQFPQVQLYPMSSRADERDRL